MTALASGRSTPQFSTDPAGPGDIGYPMAASATIFFGGMVALDSAGNAVAASASTAVRVVGTAVRCDGAVPSDRVVNTAVAGAKKITVRRGCFKFISDGTITAAGGDILAQCYAVDDVTVGDNSGTNGRPLAGLVLAIDDATSNSGAGIWVLLGPCVSADSVNFLDNSHAAKGADLTDAPATITAAQGYWRVLPAATLSATRAFTLSTTGAKAGDQFTITRLDASANTVTVVNGGAGAGTLLTMPVSKVNYGLFQFDGTNWALRACGVQ